MDFEFPVWRISLGTICLSIGSTLFANDIFEYQGGYNRAFGGAGVIMGRGGEAVLQNPANLWATTHSDAYADLGLFRLNYKLTTPDANQKPGNISIPAIPLPSFGGSLRQSQLSYGGIFFPTGVGSSNRVNDFPVQISGKYQTVDIEAAQTGFKLGLGAAYQVNSDLSLGISVIYDDFKTDSKINLSAVDFIRTQSNAKFIRPIIGLRYLLRGTGTFAMGYQFKKEIPYTLRVQAFSDATQTFNRSNYRPTVYSFGFLSKRLDAFRLFAQYSYEVWVPATFIAQAPNQALAGDVDVEFLNTHNFVLGSRYRLETNRQLAFAYSRYGKNKGHGLLSKTGELLLNGGGPQDFEAMDRSHLTISYEETVKDVKWLYYGSYIRGTTNNPEDAPNAGFYQLSIFLVGLTFLQNF